MERDCGPVVRIPHFELSRARVQSLIGELRSHNQESGLIQHRTPTQGRKTWRETSFRPGGAQQIEDSFQTPGLDGWRDQ